MSSFSRAEIRFAFASCDCQKTQSANTINRVVAIFPVKELRSIGDWVTSNLKVSSKQNKQRENSGSSSVMKAREQDPERRFDERLSRIYLGQLVLVTRKCKLQSIENAELEIDLTKVVFDYLLAGAEVKGNFLVAHASCNAGDYSYLHG